MFRYSLSWYIFAFTLLESIINTHLTVHDSNHGFITNNQRYFDNDLSVIQEEITSGLRSSRINDANLKLQLKFEPEFLDFKYRPLGVPHLEKVTLFNIDNNKSIDMTSISGSTVHFHSSFFEDKKIPPLGNTTFNVVFLGREEGYVESNLFIHTTEGHFKYNVKGLSIYSPYRLRPIVGIKLPINASFSPLIYMHNPHTQPIQIVEVYSSGGDFHLELPTGELEGPKDMWEIPPLQTKAVIRVRFQAKSEQNHTAYVRIKVNSSEEILVVPLEVEVSADGGIFDPQGSIDFGIGGNLDSPKTVELCIFNPLKKAVRIHSVDASSNSVKVDFENVKIMPTKNGCVKIGTVTLDWKSAFKSQEFFGKITIKYRNGKSKTEIPYYLTVLEGGITYDPLVTRYFINDKSEGLASRSFKVKNNFLSPARIINFTLNEDAQNYFKIENFKPILLKPQQESTIFTIKLKNGIQITDLKVNSNIIIKTNVSELFIPLLSYNGKLQVYLPFKSKDYSLDLGLISFDATKEIFFLIANTNPVTISIKNVKTSIPMTSAVLLGCARGDHNAALLQVTFQNLTKCNSLKTTEYAVIRLTVQTFNAEGQIWGDVQIETQYENLSVPVHFKVASGKLEIGPDRLVFDQCFPGKICSHPLRVHSTFNDPMIIEEIISLPPDKRLSSKHSGHILARATKVIGHLYLDPTLGCGNECYTGLQHDTTAQWLKTLSLSKSVSDFDLNLVNVFYNRYLNFTANGSKRWQNLTLRLDTSEVRGHIFKTRVKMSWPSLIVEQNLENKSIFTFPLTQIGNISYRNITIRNPASYNLVIQLVMDKTYPDIRLLTEGLPSNFIPNGYNENKVKHGFFFHESSKKHYYDLSDSLNLKIHEESIPILLNPGENFTFTVGFKSEDTEPNAALIFIRNNLTILEVVKLLGQGAHPQFKFGNRKPGSVQPLSFELTEKHLKDCEKEKQYRNPSPNLSVKRSFTARNIGDVTIYINAFFINDLPCEGYGFKILNCVPFILHPNGTKKIDIAFTPDLTLSKVTRILVLDTSLNFPVNYTLHTTIPPYYLGLCSSLIMRPSWESYLSFVAIGFMFLLFVFIVLLAIMDAERIKKQTISALMTPNNLTAQPVLDLRLVGQQTRAEIRSNKTEDKKIDQQKNVDKSPNEGKTKDGEKYTVLVPTTGKSKKKLTKKCSNELDKNESDAQKKSNEVQSKKKFVEVKNEEKRTSVSITKAEKKPTQVCKKVTKNTIVPVYEEETSSTTTDSSSNNEENDKETDQRNSKVCSKTKTSCTSKPETPPVEEKPHQKIERKKSGPKLALKKETDKPETKFKSHKPKKDRQHLSKKLSGDKNFKMEKRESPPVRVSPPITSPMWGENRATFSDVVARDSVANTRPLSQIQTNKPTMYVEPYKQTSAELGPIGSRRIDFWQDETLEDSNSYFSNSYEANPNFFEDFVGGENWGQSPMMGLFEGTESERGVTDPWSLGTSVWDSFYSSLGENLGVGQQQQQSGYLWGSSPVWQPWAPTEPKTPTRTPPGFDAFAQRKSEEEVVPQQRETYNPFGTSNIWTQQQNPWNYQGQ
ncbi:transmembrane protein 131 [Tribolium madens]|uniref:transmembrane protein 131 n=1 Tax=Tribolium madens TaxID=41895 RepID=UPI001CF76744|nr:transmembrane protein 131 [Tribolium madens]